ncbi:MAG: lysylphosphatidylglycerol synthase domain-containing protein [Solirubrobacterales bacterium]
MERPTPLLHRIGEAGATLGSRPPRRRAVRVAVQAVLALLIFGFLVLTVARQWDELQEEGVRFTLIWLLPAFAVLLLFYVMSALGWDLLLRFLGNRLNPVRAQVAWGQPMLARYVPGSVLYVLARLVLSERAGVPRRLTLASIVYEQALSAAAATGIASYFLISHPDLQGEPWRWAVLLVVPVAIAVLHPRVFGPLANRLLEAFGRDPLPATIPLRGILVMLGYYAASWAVCGVGVFFVARSVFDVSFSEIATVGSAQSFGYVAALVTLVAPAGLGVRDTAFAWAVKAALPSQSFAIGATIAIAVRLTLTLTELCYVGIVTLIGRHEEKGGMRWSEPATSEARPAANA